jgi:hypothetical protein
MSPNAGEGRGCGVSANENSCSIHVTWSPNELCRSNSISNLCRQPTTDNRNSTTKNRIPPPTPTTKNRRSALDSIRQPVTNIGPSNPNRQPTTKSCKKHTKTVNHKKIQQDQVDAPNSLEVNNDCDSFSAILRLDLLQT